MEELGKILGSKIVDVGLSMKEQILYSDTLKILPAPTAEGGD